MEAALRILSWTWFFRVFHGSRAWADSVFRERFLCALYLHGDFTDRHFEISDVNGNHCTADGAGLAFAGLFFGAGQGPAALAGEGLVDPVRRDPAAGLPGRRRLRGFDPVPPPGGRAVPAARPLSRGARSRRPGALPRACEGDGALRRGLLPTGRLGPAVGRCGRRSRAAARRAGPERPPLPHRARRRRLERHGAEGGLRGGPERGVLDPRPRGGRIAAPRRPAGDRLPRRSPSPTGASS